MVRTEGLSTPNLQTSAVADHRKSEETEGGGEWSIVEADEDVERGIRCGMMDEWDQEGQSG